MLDDLISLFFPHICFGCDDALTKGEETLCTTCRINLPKTQLHTMNELGFEDRFYEVQSLKKAFAYLYFQKDGLVQDILFSLKYKNRPEIAKMLGIWYGVDLREMGFSKEIDIIIPVPLHVSKRKIRGYNQSDYFAEGLSESLQVPWSNSMIERLVKNETQTSKSRIERWENVADIFSVKVDSLEGKRIMVVDDVITTGATISMCAKSLELAGVKEINVAAIALAQ